MNAKKKLVLVVDNEQAILDMLEMVLTDEGYEVATSIDGAALKRAPDIKPDLILLDIIMPRINTIEISHELKTDPLTKHIHIILMTAGTTALTSKASQVDGFLYKPFDIEEMLNTLQKLI